MIARSQSQKKKISIAMAWWWTWGHVFPIKSLIERIQKKQQYVDSIDHIYRFGSRTSLESQVANIFQDTVPQVSFVPIVAWKFRRETIRQSRLKNIRDIFWFVCWWFQALVRLVYHRIDIVFCKWWYVALPVVLAAALLQRKIVVHESDTHPWLVNKIAARFAQKVFTGFDDVLPNSKTVGQILSDEIIVKDYPLSKDTRTKVLVVWGSQWSRRLYRSLIEIFKQHPELLSSFDFYIVLWLLNEEISPEFDAFPSVRKYSFVSQKEMGELLSICDIAITRGGTTSLAEQQLYNLKQIIIPIPRTHDQYDNAKRYVQHHKDIMVDQRDIWFDIKIVKALMKLRNFKKKETHVDKQSKVSKAKEIIIKSFLN